MGVYTNALNNPFFFSSLSLLIQVAWNEFIVSKTFSFGVSFLYFPNVEL